MMKLRSCLLGLVLLASAPLLYSAAPNTVIATIPIVSGLNPSAVAITPDNRFVYVANNNDNSVMGQDTVTVIEVATNTVLTTITDASFNQPYTVTINPAGTKAYVTNSNTTTVTVIDIATNTVTDVITGFSGPSDMVITPDGTTGYVSNYTAPSPNTVNVVDLSTNMITDTITMPMGQSLVATLGITPDGAYVYAAMYNTGLTDGTLCVIRTSDNTVIDTIPGFFGPYNIVFTADGAYAYITNFGSNNFTPIGNTVTVLDVATNTIIDTIEVGSQAAGAALTPNGKYLYTTNYNDQDGIPTGEGTVNIIATASNFVVPPLITTQQGAASIAITPNGRYAYVANYISNTVSVIALQSFEITAQACRTENIFLLQRDLINRITWSATGASLPVSYTIYRNAQLTDVVATIPATAPLVFLDHNRRPNVAYTYYIVGTNAVGTTSVPVAVTVTEFC